MLKLSKKQKNILLTGLKIILSALAVTFVIRKVDLDEVTGILLSSEAIYLLLALVLFVASKVSASFRTLLIFRNYDVDIGWWKNLKLYWTGMFYNLFLPGGIGGDVYKAAIINKMHDRGVKTSAAAVIMDRLAGVAALAVLALVSSVFTSLYGRYTILIYIAIPLVLAGFIAAVLIITPGLKKLTGKLLAWSFLVQALQIVSVYCILLSFNQFENIPEYILVFLISSIAAMLPISIGGIGIRELVFLYLADFFLIDRNFAVTLSFTFFLLTAFSSLWGIISSFDRNIPSSED